MSNETQVKSIECKLHIYASKWTGSDVYEIEVSSYLPKTEDYKIIVPLSEATVEIEVPVYSDKQLLEEEVKSLRAALIKEKADSHVRIIAIEEKIQSLLCIEAPVS